MPYKYNPLLKLDLQKQQDVPEPPQITIDDELSDTSENAVQNKVITTELNKITDTQKQKVPKFFSSIEELEDGEIGEYQGETTDEFVNGYFYKRQRGHRIALLPNGTLNVLRVWRKNAAAGELLVYQTIKSGDCPTITHSTSNNTFGFSSTLNGTTYWFCLFPREYNIYSSILVDDNFLGNFFTFSGVANKGYLLEFAYDDNFSRVPVSIDASNVYLYIEGAWHQMPRPVSWNPISTNTPIFKAYVYYDAETLVPCVCLGGHNTLVLYGDGSGSIYTDWVGIMPWAMTISSALSMLNWGIIDINANYSLATYVEQDENPRIDTQPATDLTAVNNAITALQNKFAALIKTVTINATNDTDEGLVPLGLNSADVVVLSIYSIGIMCVPCIGVGGSGMIGCAISEFAPWAIPPATARDYIVTYIDKSVL